MMCFTPNQVIISSLTPMQQYMNLKHPYNVYNSPNCPFYNYILTMPEKLWVCPFLLILKCFSGIKVLDINLCLSQVSLVELNHSHNYLSNLRDISFSIQMMPEAASWNLFWPNSLPQSTGSWTGVFTMNWLIKTKISVLRQESLTTSPLSIWGLS